MTRMEGDIKVLIVDDHAIVRHGIRAILETQDGIVVAGEAEDGADAVKKARELAPDVVLMDIAMPRLNGLEATRQIHRLLPETKVIALTMFKDEEYVFQALKAGASGYLIKEGGAGDLMKAIHSVVSGAPFFSPAVSRKIMESYLNEDAEKRPRPGAGDRLTGREREVLQLIAEGHTNKEIGGLMGISVKTVETHRVHVMDKLDIHDMAGLIKYAIRKGLIVLVDPGR